MGFVVSKKVGNSVVRHRVTRRLREIVRPRLDLLPIGSTCVIRTLPGIVDVPFAELATEVERGMRDAAARWERTASARAARGETAGASS